MARRTSTEREVPVQVTRTRRSEEERIAELEARIAALKARAEAKKVRRDPALRYISAALRSVDKALAESEDAATRKALDEARSTLSACLSLNGAAPMSGGNGVILPRRRSSTTAIESEVLFDFVQKHPGLRGEQIAAELGTDTHSMRPVMKRLIADRRVKTRGERRGMTYTAV